MYTVQVHYTDKEKKKARVDSYKQHLKQKNKHARVELATHSADLIDIKHRAVLGKRKRITRWFDKPRGRKSNHRVCSTCSRGSHLKHRAVFSTTATCSSECEPVQSVTRTTPHHDTFTFDLRLFILCENLVVIA